MWPGSLLCGQLSTKSEVSAAPSSVANVQETLMDFTGAAWQHRQEEGMYLLMGSWIFLTEGLLGISFNCKLPCCINEGLFGQVAMNATTMEAWSSRTLCILEDLQTSNLVRRSGTTFSSLHKSISWSKDMNFLRFLITGAPLT